MTPNEPADGRQVGRLLADPVRRLAADYPALLPDSALEELDGWLGSRHALHGDEYRVLLAVLAATAGRLSTLVIGSVTDRDSDEHVLRALNLQVWAGALADSFARLHDRVAARYDLEKEEVFREAAGHGGQLLEHLALRRGTDRLRDAIDLLIPDSPDSPDGQG